jgi:hypothetical protein
VVQLGGGEEIAVVSSNLALDVSDNVVKLNWTHSNRGHEVAKSVVISYYSIDILVEHDSINHL